MGKMHKLCKYHILFSEKPVFVGLIGMKKTRYRKDGYSDSSTCQVQPPENVNLPTTSNDCWNQQINISLDAIHVNDVSLLESKIIANHCSNQRSESIESKNQRVKSIPFSIGWHLIHLPLDTQDVHPGSLIPSSQVIATACGDVPSSVNGELGEI